MCSARSEKSSRHPLYLASRTSLTKAPELTGRPRLLLDGQDVGWLSSWAPNLDGPGFRALGYTSRRCQGVLLSINGRVAATVGATLTTAEGDGGPEPEAASCH